VVPQAVESTSSTDRQLHNQLCCRRSDSWVSGGHRWSGVGCLHRCGCWSGLHGQRLRACLDRDSIRAPTTRVRSVAACQAAEADRNWNSLRRDVRVGMCWRSCEGHEGERRIQGRLPERTRSPGTAQRLKVGLHSLLLVVGRLLFAVAMGAVFLAAMESWIFFAVFLVVIGFFWWRGGRRRAPAGAVGADEVVVPRREASRLLGGKSVTGLVIWGELEAAQLPSGEMGVTLSSIHREMQWQEGTNAAKRLWRILSF
jgi:hypothetical protein